MLLITFMCVVTVAIVSAMACLLWQNLKLKNAVSKLRYRNPTEIDLELATIEQLMVELRKRPFRYVLILPKFQINEELQTIQLDGIAIESSGMPENVARDILRSVSEMMRNNYGPSQSE